MAIKVGTKNKETLNGTGSPDTLYGLAGNDTLKGGKGDDILSGGAGNDLLIGGLGVDSLHGGAGNDTFKYTSFDDLKSTDPLRAEVIVDFSRSDRIDFSAIKQSASSAAQRFIGTAPFSGVAGQIRYDNHSSAPGSSGKQYDTLVSIDANGDGLADASLYLLGQFGLVETAKGSGILKADSAQTKPGGDGNDTLAGRAGDDTLLGLDGNDTLNGGDGDDTLDGGAGNDKLVGGPGQDTLAGGAGNDTFQFSSLSDIAYDTITDFASGDRIVLAIPGLTFIGDAPFSGAPGEYRYKAPPVGTLSGTIEIDSDGNKTADKTITVTSVAPLVLGETKAGANILLEAASLNLKGTAANNTLNGGAGNDTLSGLAGNDTLNGKAGADTLNGNTGKDKLNGGSGADTLNGGSSADLLIGGTGGDKLTGGAGNDTFKYASLAELGSNTEYDTIADLAPGDKIDLSALPGLHFLGADQGFNGTKGALKISSNLSTTFMQIDADGDKIPDYGISLTGGPTLEESTPGSRIFQVAQNLTQPGTAANDTLKGGNGNDTLSGGAGDDTLNGGSGGDALNGDEGNDALDGGGGNDTLGGGVGNDLLVGGLGMDTLTGGAGNDTFKFNATNETGNSYNSSDRIVDFTAGDKIDLSAVDANLLLPKDQAFTFVGNNNFSGKPGELRYQSGSLLGDTNGDGLNDFIISLGSPPASLAASDFIL